MYKTTNKRLLYTTGDSTQYLVITHNEKWCEIYMCVLSRFIRAWLFATPWTITCQASLSMGFSRQEYWSGLPCPPPGDLPDPGIALTFFTCPALAGGFFVTSTTGYIMCSVTSYSFATQGTLAHQAPLSMEFSRPEGWSGLHIHIHMYIFINAHMYMGVYEAPGNGASAGKEPACNVEDLGSIPELGRTLEKGKATHSTILAWRIPWTV